jgi:hypothetical protein
MPGDRRDFDEQESPAALPPDPRRTRRLEDIVAAEMAIGDLVELTDLPPEPVVNRIVVVLRDELRPVST